ncbi:hypothetical protein RQP46_007271 [Phenoliferia psychrophenolica]
MAKEVVLRVEPVGGDAPLMDVMEIADSMSSATEVGLFGMDVFIAPPLPGTVAPPEPPYKALTSFSTDLHTKDVHSFVHLLQESTDSLRTLSFVGGDEPFSPPLRLLPQLFVSFSGLTSFTFYSNRWDIFGHGALSFDNILRHAHSLEYLALGYTGYSPAILRTIEMHIPKLRVLHLKLFFEVPRVLSEWIEAAAAPELEELKLGSMMREWARPTTLKATQTILAKIPPGDSKLTYAADSILIHYHKANGVVALVVAEDSAGRRMPFGFLAELHKRFTANYSADEIEDAPAYGMASWEGDIAKLMQQFTDSPPTDPIKNAQAELANVKDIMVKNIDAVLSRGERIELLVDKTDHMSTQARAFRKRSTQLRRKMWWKNIKVMILIGFSGVLLLYLLVASFCGLGLSCGSGLP